MSLTITIYPRTKFYRKYNTVLPVIVSIVTATLMVLCALVFYLYDRSVKREAVKRDAILETRRRFVRFISHEVRTPLNVMRLGLDALRAEMIAAQRRTLEQGSSSGPGALDLSKQTAEWVELADSMIESSDAAVTVLDNLLNYDKIEGGAVQSVFRGVMIWEMMTLIHDEFSYAASEKGIYFVLTGTAFTVGLEKLQEEALNQLHVIGDRDKLIQIFRNLMEGALKFTPRDGRITLSADWVEDGMPASKVFLPENFDQPRAGSIRVRVQDSGRGLTKKEVREIFATEEGFKAHALQFGQADGLILYLVKAYTEYHGGRLKISSPGIGKGSTFEVELPLFRFTSSAMEDSSPGVSATMSTKMIGQSIKAANRRMSHFSHATSRKAGTQK